MLGRDLVLGHGDSQEKKNKFEDFRLLGSLKFTRGGRRL